MLEKCEFCETWDFENVNFVKHETLKMWILWKMRLWNCDLWEICDIFLRDFQTKCLFYQVTFKPSDMLAGFEASDEKSQAFLSQWAKLGSDLKKPGSIDFLF